MRKHLEDASRTGIVANGLHSTALLYAEFLCGKRGSLDSCLNLSEGRIACSRSVVGEWRKAAIISGAQLLYRQIRCGFENTIANLSRGFYYRVDRIDDSDKHQVLWPG